MSELKPGWADEAGRRAGEEEKAGRTIWGKPVTVHRFIPALAKPSPGQVERVKIGNAKHRAGKRLDARLDHALGARPKEGS